jgi:hypothetical protein
VRFLVYASDHFQCSDLNHGALIEIEGPRGAMILKPAIDLTLYRGSESRR